MKGFNKTKKIFIGWMTALMIISGTPCVFATDGSTDPDQSETNNEKKKVELNYKDMYMPLGTSTKFKLKNATGKVIWKSSAVKIAKVTSTGNVTAIKIGKAVISAKNNGKTYKSTITIQSKKAYAKTFCKL